MMLTFGKNLITALMLNNFLVCVLSFRFETRSQPTCTQEYECTVITACAEAMTYISYGNYPKICGWDINLPFVCCPKKITTEPPPTVDEKSGKFSRISPKGCGVRQISIPPEETLDPRSEEQSSAPIPFEDESSGAPVPFHNEPSSALVPFEDELSGAKDEPSGEPVPFDTSLFDFTIPPIQFAVGGRNSQFKWPWMVAIYDSNKKRQLCGGAMIDERHVLTAAHCFAGKSLNPKLYSVQVGELEINENITYYEVQEIKSHEGYVPRYDYDDIAIMRLAEPLPPGSIPVCLSSSDDIEDGEYLTILGWGDLSFGGPSSTKLQEVHGLPVVGNKKCGDKFLKIARNRFPKGIWKQFLCAGLEAGGKDACQGDSGGPLLRVDSEGIWSLVGIVSFGYKCGEPGYPGVYTRVTSYIPWIAQYIERDNEVAMEFRRDSEFDYIDGIPVWKSREEKVYFPEK